LILLNAVQTREEPFLLVFLLTLSLSQIPSPCLERYQSLHPGECPGASCPASEEEACARLAGTFMVETSRLGVLVTSDEAVEALGRETVQPLLGGVVAGTPIQVGIAVPIQPVGLAGVSLGVVASAGRQAWLATLSLNPLALASDSPESFVHRSRLFDVSLVLPAAFSPGAPPSFIGLRTNLDLLGAAVARREFEALSAAALQAHQQVLTQGGTLHAALRRTLEELPPEQRQRCLDVLFSPSPTLEQLASACTAEIPARLHSAALRRPEFQQALDDFQYRTGNVHGGFNLRLDVPATRSSAVPFFASLAAGGSLPLLVNTRSPWQLAASASLSGDYLLQAGQGALGASLAASLDLNIWLLRDMPWMRLSAGARGHLGQDFPAFPVSPTNRPGDYLQAQVSADFPLGRTGLSLTGAMTWTVAGSHAGSLDFSTGLIYSLLL
jgi:hypothetical protein